MRIAHLKEGQVLTVEMLAELTGLKRRQIANLAKQKKIPGTTRPNGYHFRYELNVELRAWIEEKRHLVDKRKATPTPKQKRNDTGVDSMHAARMLFDIWLRKMGGLEGILELPTQEIYDLWIQLRPMATLYFQLEEARDLRARSTAFSGNVDPVALPGSLWEVKKQR